MHANNLYGLITYKKLPFENFKWHYSKIDEKIILNYKNKDNIDFILKINLEYSRKLYDLHKNYPLIPEIMTINKNILSDIQKKNKNIIMTKKPQIRK